MAALLGGAVSPVVAEALIQRFDWRWAFVALGVPGVIWGAWFSLWYRDDPAGHPGVNESERRFIAQGRLHPERLITDRLPLVHLEEGLKQIETEPERVIKLLIEW